MTGPLLGLMLGVGLALIWWSCWPRPPRRSSSARRRLRTRLEDEIAQAGIQGVTPGLLVGASLATLVLVFGAAVALIRVVPVALAFALMAGYAPIGVVRMRARQRRARLRELWPDAVDHIASAVRAGLALPESLIQLSRRGPEELRPAFAAFGEDYRATGRFSESLDRLKDRLGDPVADRLVESLRIAREVGGSDLGRLLRALSAFLREDARSRAELEARQSWTVNAARLALAAPWVVLGMLATRQESIAAYQQPGGIVVLVLGAAVSLVAYQLMIRLGRLPEEGRVLR